MVPSYGSQIRPWSDDVGFVHNTAMIHVAQIQVVSTFIHLYPLSPSICSLKIVVTAIHLSACIRVEHCLELVDGYKLLIWDTRIHIHVSGVNVALIHASSSCFLHSSSHFCLYAPISSCTSERACFSFWDLPTPYQNKHRFAHYYSMLIGSTGPMLCFLDELPGIKGWRACRQTPKPRPGNNLA